MGKVKECSDIINIAKNNTDFSYKKNEKPSYYIDTINYRQGIGYLEDEINEQNMSMKLDNYHQDVFISYDEKQAIAHELVELIKEDGLQRIFEENLSNYNDFLKQLREVHELNYCYNFLQNISDSAEGFQTQFTNDMGKFEKQLKQVDRYVTQNMLVKKMVEIFIDMIFAVPDIKKGVANTTFKSVLSFARRMKFIPYLGIVCLIIDIYMFIKEIQETIDEIHTVETQCALLESFYSRLSHKVSCVMSSNTANYDNLYYSRKDYVYLYNAALSYIKNNDTNYNPLSLYMNILVRPNKSGKLNPDSFAQISQSDNNSLTSSYFNHVKNLLLKANFFTFIQTSNYSSALINEILKESHKNESKYSVIVSNSHDINNYIYRSQQHIFQELKSNNHYSKNIVFFRGIYKKNIKEYTTNYLARLLDLIDKISTDYEALLDNIDKDNETIFKNINKYFLDSIYGFSLIFDTSDTNRRLSNALKLFFKITEYEFEDGGFLIDGEGYITKEYILSICDTFKSNYEAASEKYKSDQDIQEAIKRVSEAKENKIKLYLSGGEVVVDKYAYKIKQLNMIIEELQLIGSCFYSPVKDKELVKHIDDECFKRCERVEQFYQENENNFKNSNNSEDKNNISLSRVVNTFFYAKQICIDAIKAEFSLDYNAKLQKIKSDAEYFRAGLFNNDLEDIKECLVDIIKNSPYQTIFTDDDIDLVEYYIYDYICAEIKDLLPLNISTIERVFKYEDFKKVCAVIYNYYMYINKKDASLHLLAILLQAVIERTTIDMIYYFDSIIIDGEKFSSDTEKIEHIKQLNIDNIDRYSKKIYTNLKFITLLSEFFSLQTETAIENEVETANEIQNNSMEYLSAHQSDKEDLKNIVLDFLEEKFLEYEPKLSKPVVNEALVIGGAVTKSKPLKNVLLKLYTYMNSMDMSGVLIGITSSASDNVNKSAVTYHAFNRMASEYNKKIKFYKAAGNVGKEVKNSIQNNIAGRLSDIFKSGNRNMITKNDISYSQLKAAVKNLVKNINGMSIIQGIIKEISGIVIDQIYPTIDVKKAILDRDMLIFNYVNKRQNIPGAYWNQEKNYFTIPIQINQNFIMSDFRAMVVGGAHFDNSCFIKGTSAGIFVQANEKVSRSFIEIMIDYIDNISVTDVDKKMGKYILSYCNIINYLYQLSWVHNNCSNELKKLYDTASSILSKVGMSLGTGVIHQVKEKPNEASEPINNNYYVQTDNFLMKDFVIQLKRFGESNYKFYHTQEEPQNGKECNDKHDNYDENKSYEYDNKEIPLLLGSLIYDESWFKSTIDSEN